MPSDTMRDNEHNIPPDPEDKRQPRLGRDVEVPTLLGDAVKSDLIALLGLVLLGIFLSPLEHNLLLGCLFLRKKNTSSFKHLLMVVTS